jgi:hypothetical protein
MTGINTFVMTLSSICIAPVCSNARFDHLFSNECRLSVATLMSKTVAILQSRISYSGWG